MIRRPHRFTLCAVALLVAGIFAVIPADSEPQRGRPVDNGPAPRSGGHVSLMNSVDGKAGIWLLGGGNGGSGTGVEVPYQPWTRAVSQDRRENNMEPHTRCKPSGGVRQFLTPYGVEFVDIPELNRVYIMDIGGPHTFRVIYMDTKTHPKNLEPT